MPTQSFADKWCPFAFLSIHQTSTGNDIKAVQTGAFNQVLMHNQNATRGQIGIATFCVGNVCPFYRPKKWNPWSWGACGLMPQRTGAHILIASLVVMSALLLCKFL